MPCSIAPPLNHLVPSYNRLGGVHCSENPRLLKDVLKGEWGFDGLIMSDWLVLVHADPILHYSTCNRFGTYSTSEALNAGLDLEMPGPPHWRMPFLINDCLSSQKITPATLNERAEAVLRYAALFVWCTIHSLELTQAQVFPEARQCLARGSFW